MHYLHYILHITYCIVSGAASGQRLPAASGQWLVALVGMGSGEQPQPSRLVLAHNPQGTRRIGIQRGSPMASSVPQHKARGVPVGLATSRAIYKNKHCSR
jgi:hypothetical protein